MKVLLIGSGGREHTIAWKISRSNRLSGLYIAPGNPGTDNLGTNLPDLDILDPDAVGQACRKHRIDLVFVGPEAPLASGLVDTLNIVGVPVIGPGREAARLESSKTFSKQFMEKHGIPTARAQMVGSIEQLDNELARRSLPCVLKMDGLAAGKGVLEARSHDAAREFGMQALEAGSLVLEDFLTGYEVSIFVLIDANGYRLLPACADYKKAGERSTGPNTGGMGAVCPVPWLPDEMIETIEQNVVIPTVDGLDSDGLRYTGVLYIGLMITEDGPKVLEYNVRLGDPETQVLLPLINSDFLDMCDAMISGRISQAFLEIENLVSVGVVIASAGYPLDHKTGLPISIDTTDAHPVTPKNIDRMLFQGGTSLNEDNQLLTSGGRCLTCVARGRNLVEARVAAYRIAEAVGFDGAWFRGDIGSRVFGE